MNMERDLPALLLAVILIATIALMSGCASPPSPCPPLKQYDQAFRNQLADELESAGPATVTAISDYAALRKMIDVCQ